MPTAFSLSIVADLEDKSKVSSVKRPEDGDTFFGNKSSWAGDFGIVCNELLSSSGAAWAESNFP